MMYTGITALGSGQLVIMGDSDTLLGGPCAQLAARAPRRAQAWAPMILLSGHGFLSGYDYLFG